MNRGIGIRNRIIFCDRDQTGRGKAVAEVFRSKQIK